MTFEYHTKNQQNFKNLRAVAGNGSNSLNFDPIFLFSWESDQEGSC